MARRSSPPKLPPALAFAGAKLLRRYVMADGASFAEQRARMQRLNSLLPSPPGITVRTETVGGVSCDRVVASGRDPRGVAPSGGVVLHFHGGGYCIGSPRFTRGWAAAVSVATGREVVLPDYRLAPEHPFPAGPADARAVWDALTGEGGVPAADVCVSGDSAGGGLALGLAMALRDAGRALPGALVLLSPWLDLSDDRGGDPDLVAADPVLTPAWLTAAARAYAGDVALDDPRLSPLLGDLAGLPPMLVQAGAVDIIASDSVRLAATVRAVGGDVTLSLANGMFHDFPTQAGNLEAADSAVRQVAAFLR